MSRVGEELQLTSLAAHFLDERHNEHRKQWECRDSKSSDGEPVAKGNQSMCLACNASNEENRAYYEATRANSHDNVNRMLHFLLSFKIVTLNSIFNLSRNRGS